MKHPAPPGLLQCSVVSYSSRISHTRAFSCSFHITMCVYTHVYACVYECMHMYMHVYVNVFVCICIYGHVYMLLCKYVCLCRSEDSCVYPYICMCLCLCMFMYTCSCSCRHAWHVCICLGNQIWWFLHLTLPTFVVVGGRDYIHILLCSPSTTHL